MLEFIPTEPAFIIPTGNTEKELRVAQQAIDALYSQIDELLKKGLEERGVYHADIAARKHRLTKLESMAMEPMSQISIA